MSTSNWEQVLYFVMEGFRGCLYLVTLAAAILALRTKARLVGSLLLAGAIVSIVSLGASMSIMHLWNSTTTFDPADIDELNRWTRAAYGVNVLGDLLVTAGLLLAVVALRAAWQRRSRWESLPAQPVASPPQASTRPRD